MRGEEAAAGTGEASDDRSWARAQKSAGARKFTATATRARQEEEIVGIRREAAVLEEAQQVVVLPVNVAHDLELQRRLGPFGPTSRKRIRENPAISSKGEYKSPTMASSTSLRGLIAERRPVCYTCILPLGRVSNGSESNAA